MAFFIISKIVFDVTIVWVVADDSKFCFNCSNYYLTSFGYSDFRFRSRREMFVFHLDSIHKNLLENFYLKIFLFLGISS